MSGKFGFPRASKSAEWFTPPWVFSELQISFDLDPASPVDYMTFVPAIHKLTIKENGLTAPWSGCVWLNPPYGAQTGGWMRRFREHGHGIAMVFSRTDANWFQQMLCAADAVLFLSGRVAFIPGPENELKRGRCGAGTAMFSMGDDCTEALLRLAYRGKWIKLKG